MAFQFSPEAAQAFGAHPPPVQPAAAQTQPASPEPEEPQGSFQFTPMAEEAFGNVAPPLEHTPKQPKPQSYNQARTEAEAGVPSTFVGPMQPTNLLPRKTVLSYLQKFNAGANLHDMAETPLQAAYTAARMAEQQGYKMTFTSGKRDGGGKSYHDHGEAIDVRFFKKDKNGHYINMPPEEEVAVGKRIGKASGWASLLDEINYDPSGVKTGPHLHLAYGNERGLFGDPSHHLLNKRHHTDKNYLDPIASHNMGKAAEAHGADTNSPNKGLPALSESIARAHGIDPVIFSHQMAAESSWNPDSVSSVGATGLAQFTPETLAWFAKKHGINPADYAKSPSVQMRMGAMYLRELTEQFGGNYARGLAAYNYGPGAVEAVLRGDKELPEETRNYLFKILSQKDPSIKTVEQATELFKHGIGPNLAQEYHEDSIKKRVQDAQTHSLGVMNWLLGTGAYGETEDKAPSFSTITNSENPISAQNQMHMLTNEVLSDITLGLYNPAMAALGFGDWIKTGKDTQTERDRMLQEGGTSVERALAMGFATPRAIGMAASGSMILRGLKFVPLLNKIPGIAAKTGGYDATLTGLAKARQIIAGGPFDIFAARAAEHGIVGATMMGSQSASDYLWETYRDNKDVDMTELGARTWAGASFGGMLSAGLAIMAPSVLGLSAGLMARVLGTPEANGAAGAVLRQLDEMGFVKKGIGQTLIGSMIGSFTGATLNATGISKEIFGDESSLLESMGKGAGAGVGLAFLKSGLDWAGISARVSKTPLFQGAVDTFRKGVQGAGQWAQNLGTKHLLAELKESFQQQRDIALDGSKAWVDHHIDASSGSLTAQKTKMTDFVTKKAQEFQKVQAEVDGINKQIAMMDQEYPKLAQGYRDIEQARALVQKMQAGAAPDATPQQQKLLKMAADRLKTAEDRMYKDDLKAAKAADRNQSLFGGPQEDINLNPAAYSQPVTPPNYATYEMLQNKRKDLYQNKIVPASQEYTRIKQLADAHAWALDVANESLAIRKTENVMFNETAKLGHPDFGRPVATSPLDHDVRGSNIDKEAYKAAAYSMHVAQQHHAIRDAYIHRPTAAQFERNLTAKMVGEYTAAKLTGAAPYDVATSHISDLKTKVDDARAQLNKDGNLKTRNLVKRGKNVKMELSDSPMKWEMNKVQDAHHLGGIQATAADMKERGIMSAEAATVYKQAVDAGIDTKLIDKLADEYGKEIITAFGKVAPPLWSGQPTAEMAAMAKLSMQFGEEHVPFFAEKTKVGDINDGLRVTKSKAIAEQLADVQKDIDLLEASRDRYFKEARVDTLDTVDAEGKRVARTDFDNPYVAGGVLNRLADPEKLLQDLDKKVKSLTAIIKQEKLLPDTLLQPLDALIGEGLVGDTAGAKAYLINQGGMPAPKVEKFVKDMNTALAIAEMRRLQWFAMNDGLTAKPTPGVDPHIVFSIREKMAHAIPDTQDFDTKAAFDYLLGDNNMDSILATNAREVDLFNKQIHEITMGAEDPLKRAFGISFSGWHDMFVNNVRSIDHVSNNVLKPIWAKHEAAMEAKFPELKDSAGKAKFHREMVDAIEDSSKMPKLREKYGSTVDPLLDFVYRTQTMIEKIKVNSPELLEFAKAAYFPHRFRALSAHLSSLTSGSEYTMTATLASERMQKLRSLEAVEKAVQGTEAELRMKGLEPGQYLNMSLEQRLERLYGKEEMARWDSTTRKKRERETTEKATTLLLKDPITNPLEMMTLQLHSVTKAAGLRKFFSGLSQIKVASGLNDGNVNGLVMFAAKGDPSGKFVKYKDHRGNISEGEYTRLSTLPKFQGLKFTDPMGNVFTSDQVLLHPETHSVLHSYIGSGGEVKPTKAAQTFHSFMKAVRNHTLMGTIIPHMNQMHNALAADYINLPFKMANLSGAGAQMTSGVSGQAILTNAARHGLNLKTFEQNNHQLAGVLLEDMGPEFRKTFMGAGDPGFGRWLASIDPTNPNKAAAKEALGPFGKATSNVFGVGQELDMAMNGAGLFKFIEAGQATGYEYRVADLMKNDPHLAKVKDPELRLKYARQAAADVTNRLAGALHPAYVSDPIRKVIFQFGLTPQWWMSKATTIVDAFDAATSMANKRITGSDKGVMEFLANRRPFDQYPPEVRDAVRGRLVTSVGGMLAASFVALQATQYMINQTFTWHHPPDKWFHLHHNGNYYNNVLGQGYVRELFKAAEYSKIGLPGGQEGNMTPGSAGAAMLKLAQSQLIIDPETAFNVLTGSAKITPNQKGVPLLTKAADYIDYMVKEQLPLGELFGFSDEAKLTEMMGIRGNLSPQDKEARMLSSRQYLLQQMGAFESAENLPRNMRGELQARWRDVQTQARNKVMVYLEKARNATDSDQRHEFMQGAHKAWADGVPVLDKELAQLTPGGRHRMSDSAFKQLLAQTFNPSYAAMMGAANTPVGRALMGEMMENPTMDVPVFDEGDE